MSLLTGPKTSELVETPFHPLGLGKAKRINKEKIVNPVHVLSYSPKKFNFTVIYNRLLH